MGYRNLVELRRLQRPGILRTAAPRIFPDAHVQVHHAVQAGRIRLEEEILCAEAVIAHIPHGSRRPFALRLHGLLGKHHSRPYGNRGAVPVEILFKAPGRHVPGEIAYGIAVTELYVVLHIDLALAHLHVSIDLGIEIAQIFEASLNVLLGFPHHIRLIDHRGLSNSLHELVPALALAVGPVVNAEKRTPAACLLLHIGIQLGGAEVLVVDAYFVGGKAVLAVLQHLCGTAGTKREKQQCHAYFSRIAHSMQN